MCVCVCVCVCNFSSSYTFEQLFWWWHYCLQTEAIGSGYKHTVDYTTMQLMQTKFFFFYGLFLIGAEHLSLPLVLSQWLIHCFTGHRSFWSVNLLTIVLTLSRLWNPPAYQRNKEQNLTGNKLLNNNRVQKTDLWVVRICQECQKLEQEPIFFF